MRLFADERDGHLTLAPQCEVECHAAQHGNDDVDDFRRDAGELENGDRLVVDGHAEDPAQDLRHAVIDGHRPEHERIATIARNGFDAVLQRAKGARSLLFSSLPMRSSMSGTRSEMR